MTRKEFLDEILFPPEDHTPDVPRPITVRMAITDLAAEVLDQRDFGVDGITREQHFLSLARRLGDLALVAQEKGEEKCDVI